MKKTALLIIICVLMGSISVFAEETGIKKISGNILETSYVKPVPDTSVYDSETDSFFANSAFVGDSVMLGFQRYCQTKESGFLSDPLFLTSGSFSLWEAVSPLSSGSLHPVYQGQSMLVEDAVAKSGTEKVFIQLGTNDLGWKTIDETVQNYNDLIFRIHSKSPNTKVYVIGLTYMYGPSQRERLNNANMRTFNDTMSAYCEKYDYMEFINIGDRLIDDEGGLKKEYTSDDYVHINTEGYDVWVKVLRAYAEYFTETEQFANAGQE